MAHGSPHPRGFQRGHLMKVVWERYLHHKPASKEKCEQQPCDPFRDIPRWSPTKSHLPWSPNLPAAQPWELTFKNSVRKSDPNHEIWLCSHHNFRTFSSSLRENLDLLARTLIVFTHPCAMPDLLPGYRFPIVEISLKWNHTICQYPEPPCFPC